ncbi:MAG: ATP-binding protein [Roseburia sp.]|nr:ATP-binding protein [Roseburia sp.]
MEKRINKMLVAIVTLAIVFTMLLITGVYYTLFHNQVMEDLQAYALLLKEMEVADHAQSLGKELERSGVRLTLLDETGRVIYDNEADFEGRERHSSFDYTLRLDTGVAMRISKDAGGIYSILQQALPSLIIVFLLLVLVCFSFARILTRKLLRPIEYLVDHMDNYDESHATDYEELKPFIETIYRQHQDIMKNALARQEFTANVSHELKTPLTAISGYAELIETGMASQEDVMHFAHGIHSSANRLLALINDIIRLSELDSSDEKLPVEQMDLYALAGECVNMLAVSAEKHQVTISLAGSASLLMANRQMMEELLFNLCDNGIRYNNPGGSVRVSVYQRQQETVLEVEDTGIGIPREHRERIFERFYRVDKSRSKSTGGTGLGLAIVKHIVARHGAQIELKSEVNKGTLIRVVFSSLTGQ